MINPPGFVVESLSWLTERPKKPGTEGNERDFLENFSSFEGLPALLGGKGVRADGGKTYDIDYTSSEEGDSVTTLTCAAVTARSYHPQMVNVLLMDGSVRAVGDSIELSTWRSLGNRSDGQFATFSD